MTLFVYISSVFLFSAVFVLLRIASGCNRALKIILNAIEALADHTLDDRLKQSAAQKALVDLTRNFLALLLKAGCAVAAAAVPLWLADHFSIVEMESSMEFALRIDVIAITTAAFIVMFWAWRKYFPGHDNSVTSKNTPYSELDRVVHNLAFGADILLKMNARLESALFNGKWKHIPITRPIFITSLPRAGTTVLLEALNRLPGTATHTYRDLPFILTPVLWSKMSKRFHVHSDAIERAHEDGVKINEDSPEAFEEVLWYKFFPHKYRDGRIALWKRADARFAEYFSDHIRKIIWLRTPDSTRTSRYISKNNGNIARIPVLREMFPDAHILVPLRDPIEHSISLLRQHMNFRSRHNAEPFVKKYMHDIGHFEFGLLHKPIQFPSYSAYADKLDPENLDYWLAYWIAAFEHLKGTRDLEFVSYERLANSGMDGFSQLCQRLQIQSSDEAIGHAAAVFRSPVGKRHPGYTASEALREKAAGLYNSLLELSVV